MGFYEQPLGLFALHLEVRRVVLQITVQVLMLRAIEFVLGGVLDVELLVERLGELGRSTVVRENAHQGRCTNLGLPLGGVWVGGDQLKQCLELSSSSRYLQEQRCQLVHV